MAVPKPKKNPKPVPTSAANAETQLGGNPNQKPPVEAPLVGEQNQLPVMNTGVSTDWSAFINGGLVLNSGSTTGGVQTAPYVSAVATPGGQPKAVVILPTADGSGYYIQDLDKAVQDNMTGITNSNIQNYKAQLRAYYPSDKAFQISFSTKDKDVSFQQAIKRALSETSVSNFNSGALNAAEKKKNPNAPLAQSLYTFDSYVLSRPQVAAPTTESTRTGGLTMRADALAEFYRTVQQYVGDPALVNNLPTLAEAYWEKLHNAEMQRQSSSFSKTDIFGNRVSSGVSYTQLTEADRLEMRVGLITKGGQVKDKKGKVKASTGIVGVSQDALQKSGGLIGNAYTQLIEHASDMGIPVDKISLMDRAAKTLIPGGSVEQQKNSLTEAAKVYYPKLATAIASGLKVADIASTYQRKKEAELELMTNSVSIFDDNVQKALRNDKGPMDEMDYIAGLRQDPNWKYTKKANEASAGFLNTILKTWGKVG
jgi:hypothetical protein